VIIISVGPDEVDEEYICHFDEVMFVSEDDANFGLA
jgi:hypothetical protein